MAPTHEPQRTASSEDRRLTRRDVFPLVGAAALAPLVVPSIAAAAQETIAQTETEEKDDSSRAPSRFVYVGTYTKPNTAPGGIAPSKAEGIYVFRMNGRNGSLSLAQIVRDIANPSWVTVDATLSHLYAISEVSTFNGVANTGGITAYRVEPVTGLLSLINNEVTLGAIPAHVILDPSGKFALIANYIGANFTVIPIRASDGGVLPASDVFAVTGNGPNTGRQEAPHPHQTLFDPAGKYVFGPDLGTDKVWSWTFNTVLASSWPIRTWKPPWSRRARGRGTCRSIPAASSRTSSDELVSSITAFSYNQTAGTMTWIQTISTLPADFTGTSSTAEIIVHPNGRWVYASNRGHNTIVAYRIDQTTGKLRVINWTSTQGSIPRGFNIDPSGRLMLVGNQNSNTVVAFRINQNSGRLHPTGAVTETPVPVSFAFGAVVPG